MKDWLENSHKTTVLISLFFILTLVGIFFNGYHYHQNIERIQLDSDKTTVNILQNLLSEHQRASLALLTSYASRPPLVKAIKEGDEETLNSNLAQLKGSDHEVDWLFLTDPKGVLFANYPVDKIVYGKDLSHRDWYKGVSKEWKPYMSTIFKLMVGRQELGVALCVPVFDQKGQIIGILCNTQRVAFLGAIIEQVPLNQYASVTLTDQLGQIVYSKTSPNAKEVVVYPFSPQIRETIHGLKDTHTVDTVELGNSGTYATIASLKEFGWTILLERESQGILLSNLSYYMRTAIIGILLYLVIVVFFFYLKNKFIKTILEQENEELEQRVAHQTSELVRVNEDLKKDIAKRIRVEAELKKSQHLLSETQRVGKVGGWEFNIDTQRLFWTEEVYHIHEVDLTHDLTVEKGINFYTSDSIPIIERAVSRAIEHGEPFDVELEIITAKGNLRNVHAIGKSDVEQRRVYGFFQDISERKEAEAVKRKDEEFHQMIIQMAMNGFWLLDSQGHILEVNKAYCKMSGYSQQELLAMRISDLEAMETFDVTHSRLKKIIEQGEDRFETQHRHKDGSLLEIEASMQYQSADGGLFISFMRDITQRKQMDKEITLAKEQAEFANRAKSQFLASMSHEIRTPLNAIVGYSQIILKQTAEQSLPGDVGQYIKIIQQSGKNLSEVVNNILDLSKIEAGKLGVESNPVNLKLLIQGIFHINKAAAFAKQLDYNYHLSPDLPEMVFSDRTKLNQIMMNLVGNAIKFTGEGKQIKMFAGF